MSDATYRGLRSSEQKRYKRALNQGYSKQRALEIATFTTGNRSSGSRDGYIPSLMSVDTSFHQPNKPPISGLLINPENSKRILARAVRCSERERRRLEPEHDVPPPPSLPTKRRRSEDSASRIFRTEVNTSRVYSNSNTVLGYEDFRDALRVPRERRTFSAPFNGNPRKAPDFSTNYRTNHGENVSRASTGLSQSLVLPKEYDYKAGRVAYQALKRLKNKDKDTWDEKDHSTFKRATEVREFRAQYFPNTETNKESITETSKESIIETSVESMTGTNKESEKKKEKNAPGNSKKEDTVPKPTAVKKVMKDQLMVVIVDRCDAESHISHEKWKILESKINLDLLSLFKSNPTEAIPSFHDKGWLFGGFKLIACDDDTAVNFIRTAVTTADNLWEGAKLEVVSRDSIAASTMARAFLPLEPSEPHDILLLLQKQNPDIPTNDWKILKSEVSQVSVRSVTLLLSRESLAALKQKSFMVRYCLKTVKLKLFEQDDKHVTAESKSATVVSSSCNGKQDCDGPPSALEATGITVIESSKLNAETAASQ